MPELGGPDIACSTLPSQRSPLVVGPTPSLTARLVGLESLRRHLGDTRCARLGRILVDAGRGSRRPNRCADECADEIGLYFSERHHLQGSRRLLFRLREPRFQELSQLGGGLKLWNGVQFQMAQQAQMHE